MSRLILTDARTKAIADTLRAIGRLREPEVTALAAALSGDGISDHRLDGLCLGFGAPRRSGLLTSGLKLQVDSEHLLTNGESNALLALRTTLAVYSHLWGIGVWDGTVSQRGRQSGLADRQTASVLV